jgi:3-mercaptopyruvate sulfurtransferase SseA
MLKAGFENVQVLDGGFQNAEKEGLNFLPEKNLSKKRT